MLDPSENGCIKKPSTLELEGSLQTPFLYQLILGSVGGGATSTAPNPPRCHLTAPLRATRWVAWSDRRRGSGRSTKNPGGMGGRRGVELETTADPNIADSLRIY